MQTGTTDARASVGVNVAAGHAARRRRPATRARVVADPGSDRRGARRAARRRAARDLGRGPPRDRERPRDPARSATAADDKLARDRAALELATLHDLRRVDGGFAPYWRDEHSDPCDSLFALDALGRARTRGHRRGRHAVRRRARLRGERSSPIRPSREKWCDERLLQGGAAPARARRARVGGRPPHDVPERHRRAARRTRLRRPGAPRAPADARAGLRHARGVARENDRGPSLHDGPRRGGEPAGPLHAGSSRRSSRKRKRCGWSSRARRTASRSTASRARCSTCAATARSAARAKTPRRWTRWSTWHRAKSRRTSRRPRRSAATRRSRTRRSAARTPRSAR